MKKAMSALFLAVLIVVSVMTTGALAEGSPVTAAGTVAVTKNSTQESLNELLADNAVTLTSEDEVLKLVLNEDLYFPRVGAAYYQLVFGNSGSAQTDKYVLDLNGHSISSETITVTNYADLTITDSIGTGMISNARDSLSAVTNQGHKLTIESGKIVSKNYYGGAVSTSAGAETIINGGIFENDANAAIATYGTTTINGGEFSGKIAFYSRVSSGDDAGSIIIPESSTAKVTAATSVFKYDSKNDKVGTIDLRGGTYNLDVSDIAADDFSAVLGEDNTYQVVKLDETNSIAKIGNTYYATLLNAVNSAKPGEMIEVLRSSVENNWKQTNTNFTGVTINGNNHKLTCSSFEGATLLNGMLTCYGGCEINDLVIDLSGLANPGGKRAIVASDGDVIDGVEVIGPGADTGFYGVFANGSSAEDEIISIKNCKFSGCNYAIGTEPYGGDGSITSSLESLRVEKCEFTRCTYAGILYAKNTTFTGNTVDNGKLNIMHPETAVDGNTFQNSTRVQFFANLKSFVKNIFDETSYLKMDSKYVDDLKIDVSKNYWGGGAPSATQLGNVNAVGTDEYYTDLSMDEDDLSTYVPPYTVIVKDGNQIILKENHKYGDTFMLPEAPSSSGHVFMGWNSGEKNYAAGDSVKVTGNMTFTAVWANHPDTPYEPDEDEDTPEVPEFPFYDVARGAWYYNAVAYVYNKGLMDGVDTHEFAPEATLTRAMVWTILARMEGVDTTGGATWYAKAQEWATAKGISDGENPNAAITREQFVTMLYRLAGEPAVSGSVTAPDAANVSSWAADAMTWAVNVGLVEGDENGNVNPTANANRAEAAALIMRFIEK